LDCTLGSKIYPSVLLLLYLVVLSSLAFLDTDVEQGN